MRNYLIGIMLSTLAMSCALEESEESPLLEREASTTEEGDSFTTKGTCSGRFASGLILSANGIWPDEIDANGTWSVGGGATGVYIRFYIDGVLYQSESHSGTSGSWIMQDDGLSTGNHTLKVRLYPKSGSTICWSHYRDYSKNFAISAPVSIQLCDWQMSGGPAAPMSGYCTRSGSNGGYVWCLNSSCKYGSNTTSYNMTCTLGAAVYLRQGNSTGPIIDSWPCGAE